MTDRDEVIGQIIAALKCLPVAAGRENMMQPMALLIIAADVVGHAEEWPRNRAGGGTNQAVEELQKVAELARDLHNRLRTLGPVAHDAIETEVRNRREKADAARIGPEQDHERASSWHRPPNDLALIEEVSPLQCSSAALRWRNGHSVGDLTPAAAPEWLTKLLRSPRTSRTQRAPIGQAFSEGGRNDSLARLAGYVRNKGCDEVEIFALISAVNMRRCAPPLDEGEVRAIAKSISRYKPSAPLS